jgi:thiamine biosynthesis lipoprotein
MEDGMRITRRQVVFSVAAASVAAGAGLLIANGDAKPGFVWRGAALGGEARVALYGAQRDAAEAALAAAAAEIERLESIFSLYREASELSRLNRDGMIGGPSRDLVEVMRSALAWRGRTAGAFDPTVQPLWQAAATLAEPTPALLAHVGTPVEIAPDRIALAPGARVTLNGIAQGRIADRVTEILVGHGFTDVVIEAGELRLPGRSRRAVGIPAAKVAVSVAEVAIATSEPKTQVFDAKSFRHHLIDPRTGASPRHWQSLSVFAPTAEMADALSTAFAVMPYDRVADLIPTLGDVAVIGADWRGRIRRLGNEALAGGTAGG